MKINETRAIHLAASLVLGFAVVAVGTGCGDDGGNSPDAETYDGPLYAVQHNVNTPDGRTVYINVFRDLDSPGEGIEPSQAIEISGYAAVQAHDGALFVSEDETKQITRWDIDDAGRPAPGPVLSLANEALDTFWNHSFLYVDADAAWYANDGNSEILLWNPTTMELTGRIPVTGLDFSGLPVAFHGLVPSGDRVFMPISFVDWDALDAHLEVVVAEFSLSREELVAVHRDDRCAVSMSTFAQNSVAEDGTFYVIGDAGFGTFNHADLDVAPPACVLRIRPQDAGFDPDFAVTLDGAIDGYADASTLLVDPEAGRIFTDLMKQPDSPFETVDDLWDWQYAPGNTRRVACDFPGFDNCAFIDEGIAGSLHWYSTRVDERTLMTSLLTADNEESDFGDCAVYDMSDGSPRELLRTTGFISNLFRVR